MPGCASCGTLLSSKWSYCPTCGRLLGEAELALSAVGRAAENEAIAYNDRGVELLEEENFEEAIEAFQQAIQLSPDESLYHYNLGVAYEGLNMDSEAFDAYQRAIRLDAQNASAYLALGHLYHAGGQREEAEKCWHAVIGLAPDSDEADEAKEALAGKTEEGV
jgi:tetratricopeptide (TPR) repeat protein